MNKTTMGIIAIILIAVVSISAFSAYSLNLPGSSDNPQTTNSPTPTGNGNNPQTLVYEDVTNRTVNIPLPVKSVCAISGIELLVAIGAQDKVVGRGYIDEAGLSWLPSSVEDITIAGSVEMIVEMKPDLVIVSELYSAGSVRTLEDAGIAVIVERTVQPRRTILVENLGVMLGVEERATEFLSYEKGYYDLVLERTKDIPDSQKPTVYFEFYQPGYSAGPGNSFHDLLVETGAINLVESKNVAMPIVNAEYVIERKPDIIIRMLTYMDGFEQSAFEYLRNEMMDRAGLAQVPAVQNGKVYVVRDTIIVSHEVIGLLYYATWFHPDLFADINPAAVYTDYMQRFYETTPNGVYVYP